MRYYINDADDCIDYNDHVYCCKIMNLICDKFYSQTVEYLQHSWNCLSMEVDDLLRTMLIAVIVPNSSSRNIATEIMIADIAINRKQNDLKEEDDDEHFIQKLYFD